MPTGNTWQPCPASAENSACQELSTPWSDGDGFAIATKVGFSTTPTGQAQLLIERLAMNGQGDEQSYVEWVVGGVDGPLDFAMREHWDSFSPSCWALNRDFADGTFAVTLNGDGTSPKTDVDGLLIGKVGDTNPAMVFRDDKPGSNDWSIGAEWVLKNAQDGVTAHPHDFSSETLIYKPSMNPDGTAFDGRARLFGHQIVFQVADYNTAGIWAYDAARGTHPLIAFPGDSTRGASNLGTDGHDLLWSQGEGKVAHQEGLYPTLSIMTAPFTTDPTTLTPKRLRKDMNLGIGTAELQFAVGCGYAGRALANGRDAEIVRLSDGVAWRLAGTDQWSWNEVLGFTCNEAFLTVRDTASKYLVARVSLSSLGVPMPSD